LPHNAQSFLQTRRGTVFASFTHKIFDVSPLLAEAVARESDAQEDHEEEDEWDDIDHDPPPDPLLDIDLDPLPDPFGVDDESPPPSPTPPSPAKHHRPATINDFDGHKPPKGSHRRRALKQKEKITTGGRIPRAAIAHDYV
jgi:hypothetical protein